MALADPLGLFDEQAPTPRAPGQADVAVTTPDTGLSTARYRTPLDNRDETDFQQWYKLYSGNTGLNNNPDDPLQAYDYRGWFQAMKADPARYAPRVDPEDGRLHGPSEFKDDDHPTRFQNGIDTRTGLPATGPTPTPPPKPAAEEKALPDPLGLFARKEEAQDATALDTIGIGASNIVPRWKQSGAGFMVAAGERRERSPMEFLNELGRDQAEAMAKGSFALLMQKARQPLKVLAYLGSGGPITAGIYALLSPDQKQSVDTFKANLAQAGRRIYSEAEQEIAPVPKEVLTTLWGYEVKNPSYYTATALEAGVGTMAPGFVVGWLTRSPSAAIAVMSTQVYGSQYAQSRRDGRSIGEAHADATFYAATEGLSELIPFRVFLGKTNGVRELIRKTFKGVLTEGGQEVLNEAAQAGYEKGILGKDMTWQQFVSRLIDAGIIGGIMGGGFGALPGRVEGEEGDAGAPPPAPPPPTQEEQRAAAADQGIPYEPGVVPQGVPPSSERVELDEERLRRTAEQARQQQADAAAGAAETKPPAAESEAGKLLQRLENIKRAISESKTVGLSSSAPVVDELSKIYGRLRELGIEPDQADAGGPAAPQGPQPLQAGVEGPGEAERRVAAQGRIREQEKRLGPRPLPSNFGDKRLAREQHRLLLGDMADDLTVGGGGAGGLVYDEAGNVVSRLPSINPDWFQTMNAQAETKTTVEETEAAVQKALDGEKLGVRQARIIGAMLDTITDTRGEQVDHAKEQLEAARAERRSLRAGFPPLATYDEFAAQAGDIYEEQAYDAEWDGETRAMSEIAREALEADEARAEAILESQAPDADVAQRLTALIAEVQGGEARPEAEGAEGAEPVRPDQKAAQEGQGAGVQAGETQAALTPAQKRFLAKTPAQQDALIEEFQRRVADAKKELAPYVDGTYKDLTELQQDIRQEKQDTLDNQRESLKQLEEAKNAVQLQPVPGVRRDGEPGPEGAEGLEGVLPGGEEAQGQAGQPEGGAEQPPQQVEGPLSQAEIDDAVRRIATLTEGAEATIVAAIGRLASNTELSKVAAKAGWGGSYGGSSGSERWSVEGRGTTVTVSLPGKQTITLSGAKLGAKIRELFGPKAPPTEGDTQAEIDEKANEAATSPENDIPEPTQEQKEAENYRVGDEITLAGNVKVKIENPKGSYRFKLDVERVVRVAAALEKAVVSDSTETSARRPYVAKEQLADARKAISKGLAYINDSSRIGEAFRELEKAARAIRNARLLELADAMDATLDESWVNEMRDHYGRILGTVGRDKDHVDIYLGSTAANDAPGIFVIDQKNPATGKFDEHKVMWGYADKDEAKARYLMNFDKGWKGFDAIRQMTVDEFVRWVYDKAATKQRAWAWKPGLDMPDVKPARMAIGDYVVPVRDKDVLKAGTILHIKEVDGEQRIKLDQGGQYWYATDFVKATKPQTAEDYRASVLAKLPAMSDAQVSEAMDDPRTKKDPELVEKLRLVMDARIAPRVALTDLRAALLEDGNALLRELMGAAIDPIKASAARSDLFQKHIRAWVQNQMAIAQGEGDVARIHGLGALISANGQMKIDTAFYDSLGVELLKQAERIKKAEAAVGPKMKSTGERLRRHWELSRNLADAADAKNAKEFISDIEKATNRKSLFDVALDEAATPGAQRWVDAFRAKIRPFKLVATQSGWRRRSFAADIKRRLERDEDLGEIRRQAKEYIDTLVKTALLFEGAKNIDELASRFEKMRGAEDRTLWRALSFSGYPSDFYNLSRSWTLVAKLKAEEMKSDAEIETTAKKKPLRRTKNEKTIRTGLKDHRKGRNMKGEDLKSRFGFADVTYGDYVTAQQRQDHTNAAYDAFMDLAETLGIEPEQISLGGTMHLAFGALGHGRHAAHYQPHQPTESGPTVPVINLTNTRGDGTIAHEWTHALDFALRSGRTGKLHPTIARVVGLLRYRFDGGIERMRGRLNRFLDGGAWYTGMKSEGPKASAKYWLQRLIRSLERGGGRSEFGHTSYASNAYKLGKDYWFNDEEMLARASEAWVYDMILAREAEDNYLVNGWVADGAVGRPTYRGAPYPEGDERVFFGEVLSDFFDGLTFDENNNPTISAELTEKMEAQIKDLLEEARSMLTNIDTLAEERRVEKLAADTKRRKDTADAAQAEKAKAEAEIREKLKAELGETPADAPPPTLEDQLADMSDDDIDDMLDGITAELEEQRQDPGPTPDNTPPPAVGRARFIEIAAQKILDEYLMPRKMMRWQQLQTIADAAFGGTQAEGAYSIKDAYEAMEVAVNRYVAGKYMTVGEGIDNKGAAQNALAFLSKMMGLLPTQTRRTGEQVAFQQFSTPPHIAMLAGYAANLTADDVMLEPSAGTGSIALWGEVAGAETIVNEITEVRAELLRQEGYDTVMAEDAEHINNLLTTRPTVVLMNPPFSSSGHKGLTSTDIITRHIEAALKALAPGGRAVIIAGRGLEAGKARFRKWWKKIEGEYNVVANLSIDGSTYRKYGTTFDVQLIVIDKTGPTVNTATNERTADLGAVLDTIEAIRNARREADQTVQRPPAEPGGEATAVEGGGAAVPELPLQPPTDDVGAGGGESRPGGGQARGGTEGEAGAGGERPGVGEPGLRNEVPEIQRPGSERETGGAAAGPGGGRPGTPTGGAPGAPGAEPDLPVTDKAAQVRALGKKFAEHGVKGTSKTLEGLVELFGGKGTLKSFPAGLDPESYAKAKPLFKEALAEFSEAGKTMRELSMVLLEFFGEGLRPLLKQYARDLREARAMPVINVPAETPQQPDPPKIVTVEKKDTAELTDDIFNQYQPTLTLPGAKPHPGDLVESAAMAMVNSPPTDYVPDLPPELIESGALSDAQVESAILSGAAHEQMLPPNDEGIEYRKGFLVGDGTGVGKGREIGAIILDNMRRGNGKGRAVWISKNNDLLKDARRDWSGIGQVKEALFPLSKTKTGRDVTAKKGILYTTYSTLGSSYGATLKAEAPAISAPRVGDRITFTGSNRDGQPIAPPPLTVTEIKGNQYRVDVRSSTSFGWNPGLALGEDVESLWVPTAAIDKVLPKGGGVAGVEKSRIDQIVDWLGEDFDGVIAMDEAHAMGNNVETKGKRGKKKPSMRALAGIELQKRLPKARIVYVTATAATEVSNLGYMERLGLWGRGTAFSDKLDFITKIASAGVSAMEVAAQHMKAIGVAISRSLSYKDVTYGRLEHKLTLEQRGQYNEISRAWQMVLADMTTAMAETDQDKNPNAKSRVTSAFWGAHQRFYSQVTTSMQMPTVLSDAEEQLVAGNSVVMQLVNTNEAVQEREIKRLQQAGLSFDEFDMTPRDTLLRMVEKVFPVLQMEETTDDSGNTVWVQATDSQGKPIINQEQVAKRDELLRKLASIRIPDGPLEMLINRFGPEAVAEITGRSRRIVRDPDTGRNVEEKLSDSTRERDVNAFLDGKKRILIFSDKGGTGRSYHADLEVKNQQKRMHYLLQPGWRADNALQGFGRTHRSNQAQAPHYILVMTDIKAQRRFVSSVARRLDQLGALTKGQRETGGQGIFGAEFNLENEYADGAVQSIMEDAVNGKLVDKGMSLDLFERQMGLSGLKDEATGGLNQGKVPKVPKFLNRLFSLELDEMNMVFDEFWERLEAAVEFAREAGTLDAGMENITAESVVLEHDEQVWKSEETGAETRYMKIALTDPVRFNAFSDIADMGLGVRQLQFFAKNVKSGRIYAFFDAKDMTDRSGIVRKRYRRIGVAGDGGFEQQREVRTSGYGNNYERIEDMGEARRLWDEQINEHPKTKTVHRNLIVGSVLSVWDRLAGDTRMYRAQLDDGTRIIGRLIPEKHLKQTLKRLGAEGSKVKVTPEKMIASLKSGEATRYTLANDWSITAQRVANETRIELHGPGFPERDQLKADGVIEEMISYRNRYFIPNAKVLAKVIEYRPVVDEATTETRLSRTDKAESPIAKGATVNTVRQAIAKVLLGWKRHPEIQVVASMADLPAGLITEVGDGAPINGAFYEGVAYLVADQIAGAQDARRVLAHEVVGHFSMEEMLGPEGYADILRRVGQLKDARDQRITDLAQIVRNRWGVLDEATEAAEILALAAEQRVREGPVAALLRRVRELLRAFLKRLGFTSMFTNTELDQLITAAARRLRTGQAVPFTTQTRFSRAMVPTTTAFKRWFGRSKVVDAEGNPRIMYHATRADFSEFEPREEAPDIGFHFGSQEQTVSILERAASREVSGAMSTAELITEAMGPNPKIGPIVHPLGVTRPRGEPEAVATGANIMPVYIRIENPLQLPDVFAPGAFADVVDAIEDAGVHVPMNAAIRIPGRSSNAKWEGLIKVIEAAGYDGIVYENRHEGIANTSAPTALPTGYELRKTESGGVDWWYVADLEGNSVGRFARTPSAALTNGLRVLRPGNVSYIAFRQEQIKSATGNIGTYAEVPDIRLSRKQRAATNRARMSKKEKEDPKQPKYPGGIDWTPTPEPNAGQDAPTQADTTTVNKASKEQADAIRNQARGAFGRLKDRANDIVDRMNDRLHPLHGLEDRTAYMQDRYLTLGKIAEGQVFAKKVYETFKKASAADIVAIYDYLTDAENDGSAIESESMRREAQGVKQLIDTVGQLLVEHGIIPQESYEHYQGRYLPRLYLYYLMGDKAINAIGTGKLMSERGYAKKRNEELPQEFRDVFLGEVKDPAFLASKALGIPMRDIALMEWFETIAENTTWVLPKQFVMWRAPGFERARKVTPYWLKSEASKLRSRAEQYTDAELKEQALSVAANMDEKADKALVDADLNADIVPEGYKKMPMTSRLGTLRGMVVRSHIYDDVLGTANVLADDASMAERILGFGGVGTKVTQIWKWSKVAANPPAQVRNLVSNWILLNLSGVPLHKLPKLLWRALREIRTKGTYYQIGVRHGITESTFAANELFRIEREMLELQMRAKGSFSLLHVKNFAAKVVEWTGDRYQDAEMWSKLAKIIHEMEVNGKTEGEAAMEAQEWLFDYSLVGKNTRYLRNAPIGAPFLTFYLKVLPRILETAINHPQRFLPYVALIYGSQLLAAALSGGDYDDFKRLKKALPDWIQRKGSVMFLPVKDENGRWQVVDIGYMLPWTMWTELAGTAAKTGVGMVKGEGFGEFGNLLTLSGLLGGPIPDVMAAVLTGKDSFTGRQIVNKADPAGEQMHALITYLYNMAVPSFLAGIPPFHEHATYRGAGGHLYESVTGALDRYGQPKSTVPQALARFVGVNIYPMEPSRTRAQNMRRRVLDIREVQRRMRTRLNNANLSGEDAKAIREAYASKLEHMQREAAKYARESKLSSATR